MINNEQQVHVTFSRAVEYFNEEAFEDALPLFEASLAWFVDQDEKNREAVVRFFLGQTFTALKELEKARSQITTAHALFGELGDSLGQARMRLELGELAYWEQNYDIATKHFSQIIDALDDNAGDVLAMAHARLGSIFAEQDNLSAAKDHYHTALSLYDQTGDTVNAANILIELASVLQEAEPERARRLFERGRDLAQSTGNEYLASVAVHGIGVLHADAEEWAEAVRSYNVALELKERCDDREGEIFTFLALGAAQRELGHNHSARQSWEQALALAEQEELDDVAEVARTLLKGEERAEIPDRP